MSFAGRAPPSLRDGETGSRGRTAGKMRQTSFMVPHRGREEAPDLYAPRISPSARGPERGDFCREDAGREPWSARPAQRGRSLAKRARPPVLAQRARLAAIHAPSVSTAQPAAKASPMWP
jgi:hypothetical protein